jgi:quinolinate synthase
MIIKEVKKEIEQLRNEKNAIILAHFYQVPEIQEIADFTGDSLALAQKADNTTASIIVFAGVHFMAETAKILNPEKKVILPDMEAGCSLADSCPPSDFARFKEQYPNHTVISYINCSTEIKAMSDIICTSSNAVKIVESLPKKEKIIFAPDKNLGGYVNQITGRNMVLWNGACDVHNDLKVASIIKLKQQHPDAKILAHPECQGVILEMADYIGSTTRLLQVSQTDDAKKFIVATESGILHPMQKASPHKEFIIVPMDETCNCNDCYFMKKITLEKILQSLKTEQPEIVLNQELAQQAYKPIKRMLEISAKQ